MAGRKPPPALLISHRGAVARWIGTLLAGAYRVQPSRVERLNRHIGANDQRSGLGVDPVQLVDVPPKTGRKMQDAQPIGIPAVALNRLEHGPLAFRLPVGAFRSVADEFVCVDDAAVARIVDDACSR